ncbi:DUF5753 domain-containing protein [Streptomyces noursei]|uniref:DUF5753 domain-containing protein n=1 Tax=Streptomyces noursei TaxID=1971 RepID=UPI00382AF408
MSHVDELIENLRAPDQRGMGRVERVENGVTSIDRLAALEAHAKTIRAWDQQAIPGLLQTPRYSAAVIQVANPRLPAMEVRRRMLLKSARTEAFLTRTRVRGLGMAWFVIGESAIVHSFRDQEETHALQLRHLLTMSGHAKVMIQVLPAHKIPAGLADHFTLYGLEEDKADPDTGSRLPTKRVGFLETIMGDWYSTRLDDLAALHSAFSELIRDAMTPEASRTFIREVLASWRATQRTTSPEPTMGNPSSSPATPTGDA